MEKLCKAIAIGNFDGVHIGHQTIIKKMIKYAKENNLQPVVYTFKPHPREVIGKADIGAKPFVLINSYKIRNNKLRKMGVDVFEEVFNRDFSEMEYKKFLDEIIIEKMKAKAVFVGFNFCFGKNRKGKAEDLVGYLNSKNIYAEAVSQVKIDNETISSSKIRENISNGNFEIANKLLGYNFSVLGFVVKGEGRGRTLGYPTANLRLEEKKQILPAIGVYKTKTILKGKEYISATSVGYNPTFMDNELKIETYILDFEGDIYGEAIEVVFLHRLRGEVKFSSKEDLISQIDIDVKIIRETS